MLSDRYANGNMSLWIIYSCINAPRKFVDFDEMFKSTRRQNKKGSKDAPQ